MRIDEACEAFFARHETFHPRWGWLKKAYEAADNQIAFGADDATLRLGVGKNMVRSIRFWGSAAKVIVEPSERGSQKSSTMLPTVAGQALFAEQGFDPYVENPATLWIVHWRLLAPPCRLPVWWAAFHDFAAVEFSEDQLGSFLNDHIRGVSTWTTPHTSSIQKDLSCLLRTYALSPSTRQAFDDLVDCPFRELGLLRIVDPSRRVYRFVIGPKATLPPLVVLYASLDFLARTDRGGRTVTASRLAAEPGGPGRAFKLAEADLVEAVEAAVAATPHLGVRIGRPAGVTQLGLSDPAATVADRVLRFLYGRPIRDDPDHPASGPSGDGPGPALEVVTR